MTGSTSAADRSPPPPRRWWIAAAIPPACLAVAALIAVPRVIASAPVPSPVLATGMRASALPSRPSWRWPLRVAGSQAALLPASGAGRPVALVRGPGVWRPSRALTPGAGYRLDVERPVSLLGVRVGARRSTRSVRLRVAPRPVVHTAAPSVVWRGRRLTLAFSEPLRSLSVTDLLGATPMRIAPLAGRARWTMSVGAAPYGTLRLALAFVAVNGPMAGARVSWSVRLMPSVARAVVVAGEATRTVRDAMQAVTVTFAQPMRKRLPAGWSSAAGIWETDRRLVLLPVGGWSGPGARTRTLGLMWTRGGGAVSPPLRLAFDLGSPAAPPVEFFGPSAGNAIYVTIDDGWTPSPSALRLLVSHGIPFTTFLEGQAVLEHPAFWKQVLRYEGHLGDHTVTHPSLPTVDDAAVRQQVVGDARILEGLGAPPPVWFRPPYGAIDSRVLKDLGAAGVRTVFMWSAVDADGKITTYDGGPLRAGEIVLLHWDPGLVRDLDVVMAQAAANGLRFSALPGTPGPARPAEHGGRRSA